MTNGGWNPLCLHVDQGYKEALTIPKSFVLGDQIVTHQSVHLWRKVIVWVHIDDNEVELPRSEVRDKRPEIISLATVQG